MASEDSEKVIYRYTPNQEGGELCVNTSEKCEKWLNQLDNNVDSRSRCRQSDKENNCWNEENVNSTQADSEGNDINKVIESDFSNFAWWHLSKPQGGITRCSHYRQNQKNI